MRKPTRALHKVLKPLRNEYDYIFLDCPPSISLVSEAIFEAADCLLVPIIPTTLSLRTLKQLMTFGSDETNAPRLNVLPFFSMVDKRKNLHREIIATLPKEIPALLSSQIPYASEVEKMGIHRAPLASFAERSRGAQAYQTLWNEIQERIHSHKPE